MFYSDSERFRPNPTQSADWNRGAYLAEALGHCGECHTPRNPFFAMDNRRKFAGALTAGWRAYNISSDAISGVGGWSDNDLSTYLSTGHADGHGAAAGPMGEASDDSLTYLTPGDIHALVVYLRSVPAQAGNLPRTRTRPRRQAIAKAWKPMPGSIPGARRFSPAPALPVTTGRA